MCVQLFLFFEEGGGGSPSPILRGEYFQCMGIEDGDELKLGLIISLLCVLIHAIHL